VNMNVLITGGAGFIGSNFSYYLLRKYPSYRLICLDLLTYAGNLYNLQAAQHNKNFLFIRGDIADVKTVDAIFEQESPDIVINFAAESHVDRSIEDPGIFLKTNVLGTQVLLDACRKYGVRRFHQVSTDEVYGDLPYNKPDLLFTEQTPLNPSSPYSASKAAADHLVMAYTRTYGLPVTISRCSNNYGPYQFPEKLIPLMITLALRDRPLPVYGRGENIRDWIHVEDHCRALDLIIHQGQPGEVYNIGGSSERANIDVVKAILQILGKPESLISFVRDRPGHDLRYAISYSKLQEVLGWQPMYEFEEGLRETVTWYLENQEWVDKISSGEYLKLN
jgi:dTDP-glucose 4,6-dehydratase